jgi:lysophospholipase L1-like esterase
MTLLKLLLACWLTILAIRTVSSAAPAGPQSWFQSGTRWVAMGDSITHGGSYHQQVELFLLTRYPKQTITVINAGVSGDTAAGALTRLDWDVLAHQPSVVSLMFGMNDVGRYLYAPGVPDEKTLAQRKASIATWEKSVRTLIARLQGRNIRVILCTPSPFDETVQSSTPNQPGVDTALRECADRIIEIARESGAAVVDFHGPLTIKNKEIQQKDPNATLIGPGRVHPGPIGHLVMAYLMLKASGQSATVAKLVVDVATLQHTESEHCQISALQRVGGGVEFTAREDALPFVVGAEARGALDFVPFAQELNLEILQIRGLKGNFEVLIDDETVGAFTDEELEHGVNLAALTQTPQLRQANDVLALLRRKWSAVTKLRNVAYCEYRAWADEPRPIEVARMPEKIERWVTKFRGDSYFRYIEGEAKQYMVNKVHEAALIAEVNDWTFRAHAAALPRSHRFVVRPIAAR